MNVEDRLAILDMIGRYTYAWDERDPDAYANIFAEDGVFEVYFGAGPEPAVQNSSRAEIFRWVSARHAAMEADGIQTRHHMVNIVFDELTADTARTRTTLMETNRRPEDIVPWVAGGGVYRDEWRKTPEGWRIAKRAIHNDRADAIRPREVLPPVRYGLPLE
jgi:3-phenylpropionate/cinnamic acid dioxygenase small subunit